MQLWVGLDDDEIVSGHLATDQRKLKNVVVIRGVALSIEGTEIHPPEKKFTRRSRSGAAG